MITELLDREFLKLFNKNQLLKDCLKSSIRNEGIGKITNMYVND